MIIASDIMTANPRSIGVNDNVARAVETLQSLDVRHLPVVDEEGELVGMLSDRDLGPLVRSFVEGAEGERMALPLSRTRVVDVMSGDVVCVHADDDLADVVETMLDQRVGAVPVVDGDGGVVGIISYVDVMRELVREARVEPSTVGTRSRNTRRC